MGKGQGGGEGVGREGRGGEWEKGRRKGEGAGGVRKGRGRGVEGGGE